MGLMIVIQRTDDVCIGWELNAGQASRQVVDICATLPIIGLLRTFTPQLDNKWRLWYKFGYNLGIKSEGN